MPSARSLSVVLQVAPELERTLQAHGGAAWSAQLERALQTVIDALLETEPHSALSDAPHELCIYLTTDAQIRTLNCAYRGIDKPTDVLSFGYSPSSPKPLESGGKASDPIPLGDIVISFETAQRQAARNHHDLLTELLMLALHGTLHLMGYDDSTETERAVMNARAVSTLRRLGYEAREEWYSRYEDT
ncbi:MAG: rRNA maturation RNase YbeY [Fimbriimonadales bacterium]|nr:rRNA maturation RNase YbeY [Fimbriimonadales bacterium]